VYLGFIHLYKRVGHQKAVVCQRLISYKPNDTQWVILKKQCGKFYNIGKKIHYKKSIPNGIRIHSGAITVLKGNLGVYGKVTSIMKTIKRKTAPQEYLCFLNHITGDHSLNMDWSKTDFTKVWTVLEVSFPCTPG
jgi:hypothetical protein